MIEKQHDYKILKTRNFTHVFSPMARAWKCAWHTDGPMISLFEPKWRALSDENVLEKKDCFSITPSRNKCLIKKKSFYFILEELPWTKEPGGLQSMGLQKSQTQLND